MNKNDFRNARAEQQGPTGPALLLAGLSLLLCLGLTGCTTPTSASAKRLKDTEGASVVLHYNSWDCIFMTKPPCYDGAFLRPLQRADLASLFDTFQVSRETAVVSVGWEFDDLILDRIIAEWKIELGENRFQRAVFVRGKDGTTVSGGLILEDCLLTPGSVPQITQLPDNSSPDALAAN